MTICPLCKEPHELSQCPRWRAKGASMFAFVMLGGGMVLAAIGVAEAVRGWAAGEHGLMQGLLGIFIGMFGAWLAGVGALRLLA